MFQNTDDDEHLNKIRNSRHWFEDREEWKLHNRQEQGS